MSLKRFIERKDIRAKFREVFTKPKFQYSSELLAEPLTTNYSIIGTAFDYLARFHIENVNKGMEVKSSKWIAEIYRIRSFLMPERDNKYGEIISIAKDRKKRFIETGIMTDELIESAIRLAKIDILHRAAIPEDDQFDFVDNRDIKDLRSLYNLFIQHDWAAKSVCFLNPTFNEASLMVGGADADLILDDMLVDFKSVKAPGMKRSDFDQLMGYYLLNEIGGITDYSKKHSVNKIAIYSSRYGEFMIIDIRDIFDKSTTPEIIRWMEETIKDRQ